MVVKVAKMPRVVAKTKHTIWKYFGAMMMEEKDSHQGSHQAASFTRVLAVLLFIPCVLIWLGVIEVGGGEVPSTMLYTLWGLIGIKGAKDVAVARSR